MWPIILRTLKDKKTSLIIYCLASVAFMWMYIGMFPTMQGQSQQFQEIMKNYPDSIMKAFNVEELSFDTIEKFLAMESFSIMWPLLTIILLTSLAGNFLAGEVEKGTAEIILAKPISRTKIYFTRYLSGIIIFLIFTIVSVFAVVPLCALHNVDYQLSNFSKMAVIGFLFGWAVYSIAFMLSAIFSERSKPYMFVSGLLLMMYVYNIIANLNDKFVNLKYLSFFYYYNQNQALIHNNINNQSIIAFVSVAVICTVAGLIFFNKKDIAV